MKIVPFNSNWISYNEYPLDYFELLWTYYARCGKSIPATYYNLDLVNSVFDQTLLDAGSFEKVGHLSGLLWKKILTVQVYQPEQMTYNFSGTENGFGKFDQQGSLYLPSIYQINPMVHDFVIFDHIEDRENQFMAKSPVFEVVNLEKASNTEKTFWKVSLKPSHFEKEEVDKQLSGVYSFFDYEGSIYTAKDITTLLELMEKGKETSSVLNSNFDEHSGLYVKKI